MVSLHIDGERQGPGGDAETRRAIEMSGLARGASLQIADVGCGTGASTLVLAAELGARITAIDQVPEFLERLRARASARGVAGLIETHEASMETLPAADASLDAIWSEGAIYNIGFERGAAAWRRYLKPGGVLAVSELTWFTEARPPELDAYWVSQYSEVATASVKLGVLERNGYAPLGYFVLPERCWLNAYYGPTRERCAAFLRTHGSSEAARAIVAVEEEEMAVYERYRSFFGYGFYIARKTGDR